MDNNTIFDTFSTQDTKKSPTMNNPYLKNITDTSVLDIYNNSSQINSTIGSPVDDISLAALWVYMVVRIIWGGLAIFGNSLILLAVVRYERLQTCTNYLICSLSVSDLLPSLTVPLILVYELCPNTAYFVPSCLCQQITSLISTAGNMSNILFLSIDRYIYIAHPLRYHTLVTPRRIAIHLTTSWMYCLLVITTIVIKYNHLEIGIPCKFQVFLNDSAMYFYFAPSSALVVSLIIGFHLAIARIAHKQARQIAAQQQPYDTLAVAINQSTKKISRTLALILGVYICSYITSMSVTLLTLNENHRSLLERYGILFYWANTWVNPLIYAWRLKDFRIAFKKIFTGTGNFNEVPGLNA